MTNLETISYYEKLHDIFELVHPSEMPKELGRLIDYIEEAGIYHNTRVDDVTSILYGLQDAFELALKRKKMCILLTNESRKYEVNIYPIMEFLKENELINGEFDQLKSRMIRLAHSKNIAEMKSLYEFVDSLSIALDLK